MRWVAAILVGLTVGVAQLRLPVKLLPAGGGGGGDTLIQTADFAGIENCAKVFYTPAQVGSTSVLRAGGLPIAFRWKDGNRQFFMYGMDGHIRSFMEPTGVSCGTALGSVPNATYDTHATDGDWGFPSYGGANHPPDGYYLPGSNTTFVWKMFWDEPTQKLIVSWLANYASTPKTNNIMVLSPDEINHELIPTGCYGFDQFHTVQTGFGFLSIPSAWVTEHLPAGQRWGAVGGNIGYAAQNSYGPMITAFAPPADNAVAGSCQLADDFIDEYTQLSAFVGNANGPNCATFAVGCTPANAPTTPYPAYMDFADYSVNMYGETWDPWFITGSSGPKHGWFTWETLFDVGWYDDGVLQGVIVPFITPIGWMQQTILASPAPTYNPVSHIGTFSVASTDTHDGYDVNVGDLIWVRTCIVPDECDNNNGRHKTTGFVTNVNTSTGAIEYSAFSLDVGSGDHKPIPGESATLGTDYVGGGPTSSRYTPRIQVYDPAQFVDVIENNRELWEVTRAEETRWDLMIPHFGDPSTGNGILTSLGGLATAPTIIPDPDRQQIVFTIRDAKYTSGQPHQLVYIQNVSHARPRPVPTPVVPTLPLAVGAGTAVWALAGLLTRRSSI